MTDTQLTPTGQVQSTGNSTPTSVATPPVNQAQFSVPTVGSIKAAQPAGPLPLIAPISNTISQPLPTTVSTQTVGAASPSASTLLAPTIPTLTPAQDIPHLNSASSYENQQLSTSATSSTAPSFDSLTTTPPPVATPVQTGIAIPPQNAEPTATQNDTTLPTNPLIRQSQPALTPPDQSGLQDQLVSPTPDSLATTPSVGLATPAVDNLAPSSPTLDNLTTPGPTSPMPAPATIIDSPPPPVTPSQLEPMPTATTVTASVPAITLASSAQDNPIEIPSENTQNEVITTAQNQTETDTGTAATPQADSSQQSDSTTPSVPATEITQSSNPAQVNLQPIITISDKPLALNHQQYKGVRPVVLLILDGWGIGPNNAGNAIARAQTPNLTKYWMSYPHTQLEASGTAVGLPQGEDGNTETGHLNIGAGHIVYQDLPRINMAIADGGFFQNEGFLSAIQHVKANNSTLHLMGLIGAGGVHSNIEHLYALLNLCAQQQVTNVYIHGFTDGRDSPPTSGINYVQEIINRCEQLGVGKLASLMGRYFAMDRDRRWERVQKAYDALTIGEGNSCILNPIDALKQQYDQGVTDEFIEPITICEKDGSHRVISDNDAVIFFNYRIDRPREITRAFVLPDFESGMTNVAFDPYTEKYEKTNIQKPSVVATFKRKKVLQNLHFVTMTMYEDNLPVHVAFPPQHIKEPLGKVFADYGLRQLRTTETEKERFVSYYMNGQIETLYPGEERVIIPSKGVKSYDQAPEMSAREITSEMLKRLETGLYDVVISNICNGDMVGHTGNLEAAIQACQVVDEVVGKIVEKVLLLGGMVFITADHGNVEEMINNSTGEVDTEHSIYPVPFYIIGKQYAGKSVMLPSGILADVAPTILKCMNIPKPTGMTGRALL